ncbi:Calcium-transporting ATPase 12, plasma membrane-type [Camellia lanceoleosa]|uniref:Calcium-transporting ATPase 12, plasma membrane-type n=1 Tax=Camellia lanceoleosa TaxID=1840588 RepID=A0ACC0GBD9_9ERIC|nr:Calcium-transporting ATPase 12, plasma membrane-type [Camellia lanceoleosa]
MTDKASLKIAPDVLEMLHEGVGLNTTGEVFRQLSTSIPEISGSPTESAILSWVVFDLAMDIDELKQGHKILQVEAFNSEKKRSGVLTKMNGKKIHAHWKGAAEMILSMCSNYYTKNGNIIPMNDEERTQFEMIIKDMAAKSLRCITLVTESVEVSRKIEETGLTLLGLVGLKDPSRPGVRAAVQACRDAGVDVKMITGDNIFTAKAIAIESGIIKPDEDSNNAVIEGVTFRNYSDEERMEKINTIQNG